MEDYILKELINDNVDINIHGFHFRSHGRAFNIYYVENLSVVPIGAEMSGVDYLDILVFGETQFIDKRYYLKENKVECINLEDRFRIQALLAEWLEKKGRRHDIKVGE